MTVRARWLASLVVLVLGACDKERPQSETPGDPGSKVEGREGQIAPAVGTTTEAKPPLPTVRDRDPEEEKRKMARSRAQSAKAEATLQAGRIEPAILEAREALRLHEQNVHAMLIIAEAYYRQKKYEITQAVITSGLAVDAKIRTPAETSRLYNLQGFALVAMGKEQLATQSFKKAAENDEKNAAAWNNLGARYLEAGDVKTARTCFAYAVDLDARFYKAHLNLGAALRAESQWQEAEAAFLTALKLKPNYPEAYFNLGILYLDADPFPGIDTMARLNKAISYLTKYRELAPSDSKSGGRGRSRVTMANASTPAATRDVADDYIRIARKGIDREQRRVQREKDISTKPKPTQPGTDAGDGGDARSGSDPAGATSSAGATSPQKPGGASPSAGGSSPQSPSAPSPQKPGSGSPAAPSAPSPQKPGGGSPPAAPSPQKPGGGSPPAAPTPQPGGGSPAAPSAPSPQKPGGGSPPAAPSPQKPGPSAPSAPPGGASPSPQKPGASPPASPPPSTPAPQKPGASPPGGSPSPQQPAPQKPTPQAPGHAASTTRASTALLATRPIRAHVDRGDDSDAIATNVKAGGPTYEKILASRGTRGVDSTLARSRRQPVDARCDPTTAAAPHVSCTARSPTSPRPTE